MSHFVKCDRCHIEEGVMGTISLPPGWQKITGADLCEACCSLVHDFIRFTPERAAAVPVESVASEELPMPEPSPDKLFETAPAKEVKLEPVSPDRPVHGAADCSESDGDGDGHQTAPTPPPPTLSSGPAVDETSIEERARTRKIRKRIATPPPTEPPPPRPAA